MTLSKKLLNGFAALVIGISSIQPAVADHPFLTDNPETMMPHESYAILYSTWFNQKNPSNTFIQAPAFEFDFSLAENMEIDTYTPISTTCNSPGYPNATGIGDIGIELKYRFIQETTYSPQVAFAPNAYIPTGNVKRGIGNGRPWYYYPIAVQKSWGDWLSYAEVAYVTNGAPTLKNYFLKVLCFRKNLAINFH